MGLFDLQQESTFNLVNDKGFNDIALRLSSDVFKTKYFDVNLKSIADFKNDKINGLGFNKFDERLTCTAKYDYNLGKNVVLTPQLSDRAVLTVDKEKNISFSNSFRPTLNSNFKKLPAIGDIQLTTALKIDTKMYKDAQKYTTKLNGGLVGLKKNFGKRFSGWGEYHFGEKPTVLIGCSLNIF